MNLRTLPLAAAAWFLLLLVQAVGAFVSPWVGVTCGLAAGLLALPALRFFRIEASPWLSLGLAATASLSGVLLKAATAEGAAETLAAAPALAALAATVVILASGKAGKRCALCERSIGRGEHAFACPRCNLEVGEACGCWVHERLRCRLCEQNEVPVLPADPRWWNGQLGPRVREGRCQVTLQEAADADLRACKQCGRLQSTAAWDLGNGACQRCGWALPELPPALVRFVSQAKK